MQLTTAQQTAAFLWAFVPGALLGLLYLIISISRIISPPAVLQTVIGDVLFMLAAGLTNSVYAISQTEGKVRLYVLAAEFISFSAVYFLAGKPVRRFVSFLSIRLRKIKQKLLCNIKSKIEKLNLFLTAVLKKRFSKQKN